MHKLVIKNLKVSVGDKIILNDFNIEIKSGEIHVIMGPNGTRKSTLSKIIMGEKNYKIFDFLFRAFYNRRSNNCLWKRSFYEYT